MKKVKMLKYLKHHDLTGGEQFVPDEVVEVNNQVAEVLVGSGHAEYVPEPKKSKAKKGPKKKEVETEEWGPVIIEEVDIDNDDDSEVVP